MKEELKYPFGFLLTKESFDNVYHWNEFKFHGGWNFYYSSNNEFIELHVGNIQIVVIGYFFDIRDGLLAESDILQRLIHAAEDQSEIFLEELSFLSGRFLLILSQNKKINLFHDVSGLRSVCFHTELGIIASHDSLVKEVAGNYNCPQIYFNPSEISFSYNTRYKSIEKLIPNMTYEVNTRKIERYYPTKEYTLKTKDEIKSELKTYLQETVKWIRNSHFTPILSLTGGGDSRTSLAILKPIIQNIELFTYMKDTSSSSEYAKKTFANDKKIVSSIVDNLNLNHRFFNISNDEDVDPEIIEIIKHNVLSNHGLNLSHDYYHLFGQKNYLHIRSTALFNVGKYIFPKNTLKIKEWDLQSIAKYVQKWTGIDDDQKNMEHLDHLLKHAQLEDWYNYNPLELLFISYRLIQWHSGVVGESDIAFNTMLLLNSRHILDLMLSYPIEERKENKLFQDLIEDLWPILSYWDINSTNTLKTMVIDAKEKINRLSKVNKQLFPKMIHTSTNQTEQITSILDNQGVLYKLANQNIKPNDSYELIFDLSGFNEEEKLCFTVQFFYNNLKGRDRIAVTSNITTSSDILDLFGKNEIQIHINDFKCSNELPYIKVQHLHNTSTKSWIEASRVWIGDFYIV